MATISEYKRLTVTKEEVVEMVAQRFGMVLPEDAEVCWMGQSIGAVDVRWMPRNEVPIAPAPPTVMLVTEGKVNLDAPEPSKRHGVCNLNHQVHVLFEDHQCVGWYE